MHIRVARDQDFKACLGLDLSYETEIAWQMEEVLGDGEWGAHFREVRLPRNQRIVPDLPEDVLLQTWVKRDGFWVAVERRKVVGYLGINLELNHYQARVTDLAVTLERRRQGIASQLLQHAVEWCARYDIAQFILECQPKAQPAIAFALKHRFSFCGFQDAYWPDQTSVLFFRRKTR